MMSISSLSSKAIQRISLTATTNSYGTFQLSNLSDWTSVFDSSKMIVLHAIPVGYDRMCIIGYADVNTPWIKVCNYDFTPIANTSMTLYVYYAKIID